MRRGSPRAAYVRLKAERLRALMRWREFLPAIVKAIEEVLGDRPVYVFGSVVEGEITADSDVDVAVLVEEVPRSALRRVALLDRIWSAMERRGVPHWYPVELHLMTPEEKAIMERGGARFVDAKRLLSGGGAGGAEA